MLDYNKARHGNTKKRTPPLHDVYFSDKNEEIYFPIPEIEDFMLVVDFDEVDGKMDIDIKAIALASDDYDAGIMEEAGGCSLANQSADDVCVSFTLFKDGSPTECKKKSTTYMEPKKVTVTDGKGGTKTLNIARQVQMDDLPVPLYFTNIQIHLHTVDDPSVADLRQLVPQL
jgi:hypothetical protein